MTRLRIKLIAGLALIGGLMIVLAGEWQSPLSDAEAWRTSSQPVWGRMVVDLPAERNGQRVQVAAMPHVEVVVAKARRWPDVATIPQVLAGMLAAEVENVMPIGGVESSVNVAAVADTLTLPSATPQPTATPLAVISARAGKYKLGPAISLPVTADHAAIMVQAGDSFNMVGPPSISAATIKWVLARYGSPSAASAQAFYDLGVKVGIDPAFMLAHYLVESTGGTAGAAIETKNVGNIICTDDWTKAGGTCSGRWRVYSTDVAGAEDWYKLISGPGYVGMGLVTPEQIVPKYAPLGDCNQTKTMCNDPALYISTVKQLVTWFRAVERAQSRVGQIGVQVAPHQQGRH